MLVTVCVIRLGRWKSETFPPVHVLLHRQDRCFRNDIGSMTVFFEMGHDDPPIGFKYLPIADTIYQKISSDQVMFVVGIEQMHPSGGISATHSNLVVSAQWVTDLVICKATAHQLCDV